MARPQKNNCEYFPHLTSTRNHRKIKALRNRFGSVLGYAFWVMFLEYLTDLDGNEFEFTNIECEMFAAELGVSAAEIPPIINYCIEIELLFKSEDNFIYSESLNENLKPVFEKRNRERDKSKTRKRRENGSFCKENTTNDGVSATEIPHSIVDKTKLDKTKKINTDFILPDIEFKKIVDDWLEYRKDIKKPYKTQKGVEGFYAELKKLSECTPIYARKIIDQSISNEWQGIFELKNKSTQQQSKPKFVC